jgi:excinuclease UvrABC nuclease subunit
MNDLRAADVPTSPGVYALYRDSERMYVGKAGNLRERVWSNHSGRGIAMTSSAMRRNIAAYLAIATAADIKGSPVPTHGGGRSSCPCLARRL